MYDRRLDGKTLRFGHAGMLINDSFVMYDKGTDSLWVHVTGTAVHGPLKGKKLKFIPSTVTTWDAWKQRFPHTRVLPGIPRHGSAMGTYDGMRKTRGLGLAVLVRFKAKLYPLDVLARHPVINDRVRDTPVLVVYSARMRTATAWSRRVGGRLLTFTLAKARDRFGNALVRDRETGSTWSWLNGEAVSGPLRGALLPQLTYNPILNDRFKVFYKGAPVFAWDGE
ncbi:MAG: DUF3179 domain-containing protein [SAR324 cluster bacterium]|nr:DUF3179 domain-containing protein [SAR324 cluster bacterium]